MNIFVGNLSFEAAEDDIKKLFEGFGKVASAVIVTRKEKKTPKARGFGFVEMPDEPQALAAIAALSGKEFMGRVLKVNPAYLKKEIQPGSESGKKAWPKVKDEAKRYPREEREQRKPWINPAFNKSGTHRGPRSAGSYMKRDGSTEIREEAKPWRKREDQSRPWQKRPSEHKPWKRAEEGAGRPWKKAEGEAKPWSKPRRSGFKPWERTEGQSRPWKRPESGFEPGKQAEGESKPWRKREDQSRPWQKRPSEHKPWKRAEAGASRPWKKAEGEAKPWSKSSERPRRSGFNPSTSRGMVRGNGERGRTKSRERPG